VPFAKGGQFCRFYADIDLVVWWRNNGHDIRHFEGAYIRNEHLYLRPGLTVAVPNATREFNVRILPGGCVFAHVGPGIFPKQQSDTHYLLGLVNSALIAYVARSLAGSDE
jgi:hypothetical protein